MANAEMYNVSAWSDMEGFFAKPRTKTPTTSHVAFRRLEDPEAGSKARQRFCVIAALGPKAVISGWNHLLCQRRRSNSMVKHMEMEVAARHRGVCQRWWVGRDGKGLRDGEGGRQIEAGCRGGGRTGERGATVRR
jgi:hypothetical protein